MSDAVFTFTYDTDYRPALPIIEMGISVINPDAGEISDSAIVDSGSDVTLIPVTILRRMGSTSVGNAVLSEAWGTERRINVYLVNVRIGSHVVRGVRVLGVSDDEEAILGRNVLNQLVVTLDGPAATTMVAA